MSQSSSGGWPDPYSPQSGADSVHEQPTQMGYPAPDPYQPSSAGDQQQGYGPPPSSYSPPGYHPPPGQAYAPPPAYPYQPKPPTNGMAIASLVCSLAGLAVCVSAPVGAVLGHVARRQIRERGEEGDGMALAGIIIGWILTALCGLGIAGYIGIIVIAVSQGESF